MVIRCPKCRFTAKFTDRGRPAADPQPLCPRCQTPIPISGLKGVFTGSPAKDRSKRQQPLEVEWERRSSWLDLAAFWRTTSNILFHPSATFTALNYNAGIRSSLVFALVYGSLGQLLGRYWFTILGIYFGILEGNALVNTVRFAGAAMTAPVLLLVFVFFTAALVHFSLRLLFASRRSFSATVQVVAYGSGAAPVFNVIPILGSFLVPVWALTVWCIGLAKAHQTSKVRTFLALLLPLALTVLLIMGVVLTIAAVGIVEFLRTVHL